MSGFQIGTANTFIHWSIIPASILVFEAQFLIGLELTKLAEVAGHQTLGGLPVSTSPVLELQTHYGLVGWLVYVGSGDEAQIPTFMQEPTP